MNDVPKDRSTYIQTGIIVLIIVSIGFSGYMINQALEIQNKTDKKIDDFVTMWTKRIKISNAMNNLSKDRQIGLAENMSKVLDRQVVNERNIIGNLTDHRIIQNLTREEADERLNETLAAIQKNTNILTKLANASNITITEPQQQNTTTQDLFLEALKRLENSK